MTKRGDGVIVNVGSVNSFFEPDGGVIDYGAAKAALVNVAKSLSQELGPRGHPDHQRLARAGRRPTCGSAREASPRPSGEATGAGAEAVTRR